jgi:predicted nucleotidyltransferase
MAESLAHFREVLGRSLPALRAKYRVAALSLFGSRVRGDNRQDSDLDVLVSYSETPTLFELVALENELCDLLGVKVDLVMQDALKPEIRARVLRETLPV